MSDTVISVENVSKSYRLGQIGGGTLKEDVSRWWAKLRGQPDPTLKIGQEHHARLMGQEFWALQDVSFEVKQGEVLGIIGRNGAGKSTLLKILSQVTTPTSGEIKVRGRIASLLEVGTGFHPDLTGRENIFLNGAILGMTKAEIRKKFDEIVDFSGIEEFIDTPVKRYSSGMYVRLAFAVAAHLEPEILIVDEVLAVGDAEFQKKCMSKIQDVSRGGRTILFVSHNMTAVQSLCSKGILLRQGRTSCVGNIEQVLTGYLREQKAQTVIFGENTSINGRMGNGRARFTKLSLTDLSGSHISEVPFGAEFFICGQISNKTHGKAKLSVAFAIAKAGGDIIFTSHHDDGGYCQTFNSETLEWKASLTPNVLKPGLYSLYVGITDEDWNGYDYIPDCMTFEILPITDNESQSRLDKRPGVILPPKVAWEVVEIS